MSYHHDDDTLRNYTYHPRIIPIVEQLVGKNTYVSQSKINLKHGIKGKKWEYHRGFTFWHYLDGMPNNSMISLFIYLTEHTIENGAVYGLLGSHKDINLQTIKKESNIEIDTERDTAQDLSISIKDEYIKEYESKYMKHYFTGNAGDVLIMHSCLLHASENNITSQSRDVMITVYNKIENHRNNKRPSFLCEQPIES